MKGWSERQEDSQSQTVAKITLSGALIFGKGVTPIRKLGVDNPCTMKNTASETKDNARKLTLMLRTRLPATATNPATTSASSATELTM
ncbi:hypothetical protein OMP38_31885 [Cohnella ginsengisoli]|uniref:Uncharacterized protein n=1 Tax=Cohnella ginsengisoli TaxID=425004 RepID=A0A9X4QQU5_9BACL|nr:hypothetical protein [Cohnella ginsengisoli]MDG0794917.1 hypothetical protein [Cohnella ginsengisoli]